MTDHLPHISVCICTFKRPRFLKRLLDVLNDQKTDRMFTYSIVVVDNDLLKSAEQIASIFKDNINPPVKYCHEPVQGFSYVRNTAVHNATGDFLAFIDDDEFPDTTWLKNLFQTLQASNAAGVLGPVIPHFETPPPSWVIRSKLLDRERNITGTILDLKQMRTGNVLLSIKLFNDLKEPFDHRFGKIGGEDADFFRRMVEKGNIFVWCDEAPAFETVPPERFSRGYFIKRALLRGVSQARLIRQAKDKTYYLNLVGVIKSIFAILLYTIALPFLFIAGHHLFMRYIVRNCDHVGKVLALCSIEVIKERDF